MQKSKTEHADEVLAREFSFAAEAIPDHGFSAVVGKRVRRMRLVRQVSLGAAWLVATATLFWVSPGASWLSRAWSSAEHRLNDDPSLGIALLMLVLIPLPLLLFSEDP